MPQRRPHILPLVEPVEQRRLLSSAPTNVNLTALLANTEQGLPPTIAARGNQTVAAIVIDPADPTKVFAVGNLDTGRGLLVTTSADGGQTWTPSLIATPGSGLPPAFGEADAAFDLSGNLFLTYVRADRNQVDVLLSADQGASFGVVGRFSGNVANPKIATGGPSVWVAFQRNGAIDAASATDAAPFAPFVNLAQGIPRSAGGTLTGLAVEIAAPAGVTQPFAVGEAAVAFQRPLSRKTEAIDVAFSSGAKTFSSPDQAGTAHLGGNDRLPAQPNLPINTGAQLAFANPGDTSFGNRLYLAYADTEAKQRPSNPAAALNTNIFISYVVSGQPGWSSPAPVATNPQGSLFLPRISIDPSAPNPADHLVVTWYDTSLDLGTGGPTDTDGIPNDDAEYNLALLTPGTAGLSVGASQQVSAQPSNEHRAMSRSGYGDALAFDAGVVLPLWSDNSNSTNDNTNGTLRDFNVYAGGPIADTSLSP